MRQEQGRGRGTASGADNGSAGGHHRSSPVLDPAPVAAMPHGWGVADHPASGPGGDDRRGQPRGRPPRAAVAVRRTSPQGGVYRSWLDAGLHPSGDAVLQALGGDPSIPWGVLPGDHEKGQVAS